MRHRHTDGWDLRLRRAAAWWTQDYAPLDGRVRALFYALMLVLGHHAFTYDIPHRVATCPAGWFQPVGLAAWFFGAMDPADIGGWLRRLAPWLTAAWIGAAAGVCGRWPGLVAGGIMVYAWGAHQSCSGTGHVWHVPMMACLCLGLLNRPDAYSLDAVVHRRWAWWPFRPEETAGAMSGYARKLILLCVVAVFFSAGYSKVAQAGWRWVDGEALAFYLMEFAAPKGVIGQTLRAYLLEYPGAIRLLSVWTLALELSIPVMLVYPRSRNLFLLNAAVFHLGVYLLMIPRYFPQMAVYLLLIHRGRRGRATGGHGGTRRVNAAVACFPWLLVALWAVPLLRQREYFPLSHIPMYSTRVTATQINRYPRTWFQELDGLHQLVREQAHNDDLPWWTLFEAGRRIHLAGWRGEHIESFPPDASDPCVDRFLWQKRMAYALLNDLRTTDAAASGVFPSVQQTFTAVGPCLLANPAHHHLDGLALYWEGTRPTLLATFPRPPKGVSPHY